MSGTPQHQHQFQSTLPRGSDAPPKPVLPEEHTISIHAPSRERHKHSTNHFPCNLISIHAPSRERLSLAYSSFSISLFQSTLPRGSDLPAGCLIDTPVNFNPRSLAGATKRSIREICNYLYFNPRSLAGATNLLIVGI